MRQDLWLTARRDEIIATFSLGGDKHPFGYSTSSSVEQTLRLLLSAEVPTSASDPQLCYIQ